MHTFTEPAPVVELAIGILMLVAVMLVHGLGIRIVTRRFSRAWARMTPHAPQWRADLLLGLAVGGLAALHLAETLLFAAPLAMAGLLPSLRDSYYFVLESYTTLGDSDLALPEAWRLLGPIIAMSGLFTFGWTGSVLVSVMTQLGRLDREQAQAAAQRPAPEPPARG
jgi:hypothetical protein